VKFHDSLPSVNWLAGCRGPRENAALVAQQMSRAHKYFNRLVEIERHRCEAYVAARAAMFPALADAERAWAQARTDLDEHRKAMKAKSAAARKRISTPEDRVAAAAFKEAKKLAAASAKELREATKASAELAAVGSSISEDAKLEKLEARAACGVYWGTYLGVEAAAQQACAVSGPPKFKRWSGDGTVSVQVQGGLTWAEVMACADSRVRFEPGYWGTGPHGLMRGSSRGKARTSGILWLRIGSDGRTPVWAKFPAFIHREIPSDARIKWVHVDRIARANRFKWQVRFVLARESGWSKSCAASGTVGIDLGWRLRPGGRLRVAYWVGDDGRQGELLLPARVLGAKQLSEDLRSIRDLNYNAMRARLAEWLRANVIPDWLAEAARNIAQWRSPSRAEMLFRQWSAERFASDEHGFSIVANWRNGSGKPHEHGDLHLWRYETGSRVKVGKARKDFYRKFARELAKGYAICRVEKLDVARLVRLPEPEEEKPDDAVKEYRRIAAVAELVECLKQSGMQVDLVPARNSTLTCNACGHVNNWNDEDRARLLVCCQGCEAEYDQDENAARNFLASGSVLQDA